MTREVITLQLGNFANHVGAHYWNIQVSRMGRCCTVGPKRRRAAFQRTHRHCRRARRMNC
jgi:hypothetical protein